MKKIIIYSNGFIHCSVCADAKLTKKEVEAKVNSENPTGIRSSWEVSKDSFNDGSKNPGLCEHNKSRKHYLMVC